MSISLDAAVSLDSAAYDLDGNPVAPPSPTTDSGGSVRRKRKIRKEIVTATGRIIGVGTLHAATVTAAREDDDLDVGLILNAARPLIDDLDVGLILDGARALIDDEVLLLLT